MLRSDKIELAIYRAIETFGAGSIPPQITLGMLSQRIGEYDQPAIIDRLKYLDDEGYIALTKYNGGTIWPRGDSPDAAFFHIGAFMVRITPRGRKYFEGLEQNADLEAKKSNEKMDEPIIFISCGQSTPSERQLGKDIAVLVERKTGCQAYFAENQNSLDGVTEHILKKLHKAAGFIAVMHPRGNVSNPHNAKVESWVRGSVWVEQEIAIAAFMSQVLGLSMQVQSYIHHTIEREGLRDKILLNPKSFREDAEILADLALVLPSWHGLTRQTQKEEYSLKPKIISRRAPVPGEGEDRRYELLVTVINDGERDVADATVNVEFPSMFLDSTPPITVKPSGKSNITRLENSSGALRLGNIYPGLETSPVISGLYYVIRGNIRRDNSSLLDQEVIAIVSSASTKSSKATKTIRELSSEK